MPSAVELTALTRTYRTRDTAPVVALDHVDLAIEEGSITGILGENGAGKTTLTKILATLLFPTSGTAHVFGHDVVMSHRAVRAVTTAVFGGDRGLYPMLSGRDNLRYFGALSGVGHRDLRRRMPQLLAESGLESAADRRVETYSKGMRQRLHICIGLLTRPRLLLLDEPTVGLDPTESARLREVIARFPEEGTTVVLTSHNLLDIERLARRIVMMSHGSVVHDLGVSEFRRLSGTEAMITVRAQSPIRRTPDLSLLGARVGEDPRILTVPVREWSPELLGHLSSALTGQSITGIDVRSTTLDEAFAAAAGTPPQDA